MQLTRGVPMTHPLSHTPQSLCETGSECGVQLCGAVQASVVNGYPMHSVTGAKELLRVYTSFQATMRTTVRRVFVNQVSSAHAQHGAARLWARVRSGRVCWPGSARGACGVAPRARFVVPPVGSQPYTCGLATRVQRC